jgi:hypothetical protein
MNGCNFISGKVIQAWPVSMALKELRFSAIGILSIDMLFVLWNVESASKPVS